MIQDSFEKNSISKPVHDGATVVSTDRKPDHHDKPSNTAGNLRIARTFLATTAVLSMLLASCSRNGSVEFDPIKSSTPRYSFGESEAELALSSVVSGQVSIIERETALNLVFPLEYGGKMNLPWNEEAIVAIGEAIELLPRSFIEDNTRKPTKLVLICDPYANSLGVGGGYANNMMILFISKDFSSNRSVITPWLDGGWSETEDLKFTLAHEWAHSMLESHPDLLTEWADRNGWTMENGVWLNDDPRSLFYRGGSNENPWEDFATKVATMILNPSAVPIRNVDFFMSRAYFKDWNAFNNSNSK